MDQDDLETTMRHGLAELANDAPRGERLWETTTSMIAIRADEEPPEEKAPPEPTPQPSTRRRSFALGIVIGIVIGAIVVALIALLLNQGSGTKHSLNAKPVATKVSKPNNAPPRPGPETAALLPQGPVPDGDVVFNDEANGRIVVADGSLDELGLIVPSTDTTWRALQMSPDRTHLYVVKVSGSDPCDELWDYDLQTHDLHTIIGRANVIGLSSDASRALVQWVTTCASSAGRPPGQVALFDVASGRDLPLPDVSVNDRVNVAWSPDGTQFAVEPVATHHVVVYSATAGSIVGQFDRPKSSQDGIGWTSDGLVLVDLGADGTSVLRTYDPATGQPIGELARVPRVKLGNQLVTPQVTSIQDARGQTYIEIAGGADKDRYGQLRVIHNGKVPIVIDGWYSRDLVG